MPRRKALEENKSAHALTSEPAATLWENKFSSFQPRPWGCVTAAPPTLSHQGSEELVWLLSFFAPRMPLGAGPSFGALGGARANLHGSLREEDWTRDGRCTGGDPLLCDQTFCLWTPLCPPVVVSPWASSWVSSCLSSFTGEMDVRIASFHKDAVRPKGLQTHGCLEQCLARGHE